MIAYIILLLAALSRFVPLALHGVGLNITAVNGGLLFFGARRPSPQFPVAVILMALTDVYLTTRVFGYAFHPTDYAISWAWYGTICLIGSGLLRRLTALRLAVAVVSSATGFFVLSNLQVWAASGMYAHSLAGLMQCYVAGLPFYGNDLVSTALTAGTLFYMPLAAASVVKGLRTSSGMQPLN